MRSVAVPTCCAKAGRDAASEDLRRRRFCLRPTRGGALVRQSRLAAAGPICASLGVSTGRARRPFAVWASGRRAVGPAPGGGGPRLPRPGKAGDSRPCRTNRWPKIKARANRCGAGDRRSVRSVKAHFSSTVELLPENSRAFRRPFGRGSGAVAPGCAGFDPGPGAASSVPAGPCRSLTGCDRPAPASAPPPRSAPRSKGASFRVFRVKVSE